MSLYNLIHGHNPFAGILLRALDLSPDKVGRFRDCYLQREETSGELRIHVYTRNGGGNRDNYETVTEHLQSLPGYVRDYDDDFDCTYATYEFKVPEALVGGLTALAESSPDAVPKPPAERFQDFMTKLQEQPDDPAVQRVTEAMKPVFEQIAKAAE